MIKLLLNLSTESDIDEDTIIGQVIPLVRCAQNNLLCASLIASNYYFKYHDKNEVRTSGQSGYSWLITTPK
jgi:hypothetical protein